MSQRLFRNPQSAIRNIIDSAEEYLMCAILIFIPLALVTQIVAREFFGHSLAYTEELVRYLFVWATMFGIASGVKCRAHLSLDLLSRRLRPALASYLRLFGIMVAVLFFGLLLVLGVLTVKLQIERNQRTLGLGWPLCWATLSVPVGAALAILRWLQSVRSPGSDDVSSEAP